MAFIEAPHIKTPICARMPIPKDRLAVFTIYQSVIKDQALEETVLALFHPVVEGFFKLLVLLLRIQSRPSEYYVFKCVGGR